MMTNLPGDFIGRVLTIIADELPGFDKDSQEEYEMDIDAVRGGVASCLAWPGLGPVLRCELRCKCRVLLSSFQH